MGGRLECALSPDGAARHRGGTARLPGLCVASRSYAVAMRFHASRCPRSGALLSAVAVRRVAQLRHCFAMSRPAGPMLCIAECRSAIAPYRSAQTCHCSVMLSQALPLRCVAPHCLCITRAHHTSLRYAVALDRRPEATETARSPLTQTQKRPVCKPFAQKVLGDYSRRNHGDLEAQFHTWRQ